MNIDANIILLNENSSSRMFSEVEKHIKGDLPKIWNIKPSGASWLLSALIAKVVVPTAVPIPEATPTATRDAPPVKGANKSPPSAEPKVNPIDECVFPIFFCCMQLYSII